MAVCPRDSNLLGNIKVGNSEGKECPACSGIWLPYESVKKLYDCQQISAPSKHYHDSQPDFEYNCWDSKIFCPNDKSLLKAYEFREIEIDICMECIGLWLDKNELKKLSLRGENLKGLFFGSIIRGLIELIGGG